MKHSCEGEKAAAATFFWPLHGQLPHALKKKAAVASFFWPLQGQLPHALAISPAIPLNTSAIQHHIKGE